MEFTRDWMKELSDRAEAYMDAAAQGTPARMLLADIYASGMPGKTLEQGLLMADALLRSVKEFDEGCRKALNDPQEYLEAFAGRMEAGKTEAQRCELWLKVSLALSALNAEACGGSPERRDLLARIESIRITDEEAVPEYLCQLRSSALEAMRDCGGMHTALSQHAQMLKTQADAEASNGLIIDIQAGSREEYRAFIAMLLYVDVKNGRHPQLPVDTTLMQTAALVCAEVERLKTGVQVDEGNMSEKDAKAKLNILSIVIGASAVAGAAAVSMAVGLSLLGFMAMIPALMAAASRMLIGVDRGVKDWKERTGMPVRTSAIDVKRSAEGLRKLADGAATSAAELVEAAKARFEQVLRIVCNPQSGQMQEQRKEQTRTQEVEN